MGTRFNAEGIDYFLPKVLVLNLGTKVFLRNLISLNVHLLKQTNCELRFMFFVGLV